MTTDRRGVFLALGAAVLFGLSTPILSVLATPVQPQLLAGLLYLGSGLGLGSYWVARRSRRHASERPLTRADLPWLGGAIVAGGVAAPVLLVVGLTKTTASAASLLLNLEGVFTAMLAWFVFRENFDRRIALGMLAIVAGAGVLSWQGEFGLHGAVGPMLVAAACLAWAVDNNLTQRVSGADPIQTTALKGLVAGTVNAAIGIALSASSPGVSRILAAMLLGFLSYGISLVLYVRALRMLGTARTGAYFAIAPFIGVVLSIAIRHEAITAPFIAAAALMAFGVWLHISERHAHEHTHTAMTHDHAHLHDEHHTHTHAAGDPPVTDPVPHRHAHAHEELVHTHPHYPDIHHRHDHE